MKAPKIFGIWITQKCTLRCSFCPNSDQYFKTGTTMSLDTFKSRVQEAIEAGVEYIDLTPIIGEVLIIPDLHLYLDYLDYRDEIIGYTFITALIANKKQLDQLFNRPKLRLEISLYGVDQTSFKLRTNKDAFKAFYRNFKYLVLNCKDCHDIGVINRTHIDRGPLLEQKMSPVLKFLLKRCTIDNHNAEDRSNYIEESSSEPKSCYYMQEPLLTDEGICFCCMDWHKKSIAKKSIKEFYNTDEEVFLNNVKRATNTCNTKCGWYSPPVDEDAALELLKVRFHEKDAARYDRI